MPIAPKSVPTVCIVDDDEAIRDALGMLLVLRGFEIKTFASAVSFLAEHRGDDCDCLLLDLHMPEMTGLALLNILRGQGNRTPAIFVTAGSDPALVEQFERAGAFGFLRKPVDEEELLLWIDRAIASGAPGNRGAEHP